MLDCQGYVDVQASPGRYALEMALLDCVVRQEGAGEAYESRLDRVVEPWAHKEALCSVLQVRDGQSSAKFRSRS